MAGIRLEWAQFGDFDSFDVIRSDAPMDINALPSPIATNLPTMYYVDTTVVEGATYYYRVVARRDAASKVSGEIKLKASAGDEYWSNVVSLLHFDGGLTDETGITWSAKNSPTYTAGVFNNAIKLQSSSKQCVYSSNSIADFGSSDFTVEFFINFQSFNADACVLTGGWNYSAGKRTWGFLLGEGSDLNKLHFYCSTNGSTSYICSIKGHTLSTNTTYHVAAVREGSTFRLFLNGVLVGTSTSSASIYSDLSSGVTVGSYSQSETNSSYYVNAWFDELRITKGVARYTEDFIPPDAPFSSY